MHLYYFLILFSQGVPSKLIDSRSRPASDIYTGLREILKLPQGFCLVKCDTLKPGQTPLSADDVYALTNKYPLDGSGSGIGSGYPGETGAGTFVNKK